MLSIEPEAVSYIVACVMTVLVALPAIVLALCALCLVRRRQDPVRRWSIWLKIALALFGVSNLLLCLTYLILVAFDEYPKSYSNRPVRDNLYDAEAQMAQVAILLDNLTQVVVLLALVGINTGISMILNGSGTPGKPKKLDAAMRWITYGFSLVLAVLAIAAFAVDEREMFWENDDRFYMLDYNGAYGDDNVRTGNALSLAFDVIFFVMVLLLTAKAIMTLVPAKREPRVRKGAKFVLASSLLLVVRGGYSIGYFAGYTTFTEGYFHNGAPFFLVIVSVILDSWTVFTILCLLYALGAKKKYGAFTSKPRPLTYEHHLPPGYQHHEVPSQEPPARARSGVGSPTRQSTQGAEYPHDVPLSAPNNYPIRRGVEDAEDVPPPRYPGPPPQLHMRQGMPAGQIHQTQPGPVASSPSGQVYEMAAIDMQRPPGHDEAMGLNHQADGTPPISHPLPYPEKGGAR